MTTMNIENFMSTVKEMLQFVNDTMILFIIVHLFILLSKSIQCLQVLVEDSDHLKDLSYTI